MKPNISEFSYGYALTEQLVSLIRRGITAAPYFPTLRAEGQLGYDLRLNRRGFPLFLQFKLSHKMIRNSAREINHHALFARGTQFFRMHLRKPPSNQHQLLLNLEGRGNKVYYVAPAFHEPDELDDAYLNRRVPNQSVFIRPSWLGPLPDKQEHWVAFELGGARHFLSDEPQPVEGDIGFAAFERDIERALSDTKIPLGKQLEQLPEMMAAVLREYAQPWVVEFQERGPEWTGSTQMASEQLRRRLDSIERHRQERKPLEFASYLSRVFFDCELCLVRTRDNETSD